MLLKCVPRPAVLSTEVAIVILSLNVVSLDVLLDVDLLVGFPTRNASPFISTIDFLHQLANFCFEGIKSVLKTDPRLGSGGF